MEQSWQSASNYAAPLDNPHGLITWQLRELVKGISLRPDLARMLLTGAAIEDNGKADEIIKSAHAAVALDAKANNGTAVHAALSRSFLGHPTPAEYVPHVNAFAEALRRNGLTPVATEVELLNVALGVLGHGDWIVKTADGRHMTLDVKTGRLDGARKFAVQCESYDGAEYIGDGKNGWMPIPFRLDREKAILAHVDPETGATALYEIDLILGRYGAVLAEKVRGWHKIDVLKPYVPAHPAVPSQVPTTAVAAPATPSSAAAPAPVQPSATADEFRMPAEWFAYLGLDITIQADEYWATTMTLAQFQERYLPQGDNLGASQSGTQRTPELAHVQGVSFYFDELMQPKNDKAKLQGMAASMGCKDLAHNRRWLARWIIATSNGAEAASAAKYAAAKDDESIAPPSVPVSPTAEQPSGDLSFIFKSIEGARSEGALLALRDNVVERRGDHAWTDEMAEAARQKVLTLIAAENNAVDPVRRVIARIAQATEPKHIADLWSEVTIGGSAQELWTDEIKAAANKRMGEIQASQPAPPANPYGPQQ